MDFVYPDGKEEKNIVISGHNHDILGESLVQIVKNLPVEDFLRRVSLATEKEFSSDLLFVTERMISRDPSKRLKEGDLKILAGILAGTTECRLEKKTWFLQRIIPLTIFSWLICLNFFYTQTVASHGKGEISFWPTMENF